MPQTISHEGVVQHVQNALAIVISLSPCPNEDLETLVKLLIKKRGKKKSEPLQCHGNVISKTSSKRVNVSKKPKSYHLARFAPLYSEEDVRLNVLDEIEPLEGDLIQREASLFFLPPP